MSPCPSSRVSSISSIQGHALSTPVTLNFDGIRAWDVYKCLNNLTAFSSQSQVAMNDIINNVHVHGGFMHPENMLVSGDHYPKCG